MRKRYAIPALVLLAAFAGLLTFLGRPDPPGPGVTWANAARIEVGMTEAELLALIGGRPVIIPPLRSGAFVDDPPADALTTLMFWSDSECDVLVYIDRNHRVVDVRVNGPPAPTWPDRARKRLGL